MKVGWAGISVESGVIGSQRAHGTHSALLVYFCTSMHFLPSSNLIFLIAIYCFYTVFAGCIRFLGAQYHVFAFCLRSGFCRTYPADYLAKHLIDIARRAQQVPDCSLCLQPCSESLFIPLACRCRDQCWRGIKSKPFTCLFCACCSARECRALVLS